MLLGIVSENNIGNSQVITFYDMVLKNTNGERCDVVINTLSDNLRKVSTENFRCCNVFSIFIIRVNLSGLIVMVDTKC